MARFRSRKTFKLVTHLREGDQAPLSAWKREEQGLSRDLEERCSTVQQHCGDAASHLRLGRLVPRLTHYDTVSENRHWLSWN